MRNLRRFIPIVLALLFLTSCRTPRQVERGFYYWKSRVRLDAPDIQRLNKLQVHRLYIKCFDVIWDPNQNQALPVAEARFVTAIPKGIKVIPTVYITNDTLRNLSLEDMPLLADKIRHKAMAVLSRAKVQNPAEFQIDCDWTLQTRDKYFALLRSFRKGLGRKVELTATIRLHQVKYSSKTGVPPVDRGVLMAYNLESPADNSAINSIIRFETAKPYLESLDKYPLPLDVALPLYSLGAIFQGDRCIGLIADLTVAEMEQNDNFVPIGPRLYRAKVNTHLRGAYIYKNDRIRIDESDHRETLKVAALIRRKLRDRQTRMILFDYDSQRLRGVRHAQLETLYRSLR